MKLPLREKCPYLELFWSAFSCIQNEYGEILRIYSYSVRMLENAEKNNSEYGHFLRSVLSSTTGDLKTELLSKTSVDISSITDTT